MYPFFSFYDQVGGLGDVVTSLSRAVQELNHHVDIIFPKYDCLNLSNVSFITVAFLHISHPINPLCIIYLFIFFHVVAP